MFSFFKKKKKNFLINCTTDTITINNETINFPTNYDTLTHVFGKPSREIFNDKNYIFWDKYGVFCGCSDKNKIISINFFQNRKDSSKYNTKKQFKGELFLNNDTITNNEFETINLGNVAIHRLGSVQEIRYGFSLGLSSSQTN